MPHAYTTTSVAGRIKSLVEINPTIEPKDVADQIECTTEYANHVMCRLKVRSRVHCGDFRKSALVAGKIPDRCPKCNGQIVIERGFFSMDIGGEMPAEGKCVICGRRYY